jgi:mRNA deadenylase 3'-5' endonuclease subunit Ccr4
MDLTTSEPHFTNCTRDFLGTLDYIFYTGKRYSSVLYCTILFLWCEVEFYYNYGYFRFGKIDVIA